jgi:adenylosuccinate synthase
MSSTSSKLSCVTCNKGIGQFKCEGCSQTFCIKHATEHRQALSQKLDEVILEHDMFQQTITEDKNENHSLIYYIDQWEEKSIDKIRQIAKEIRQEVNQLENIHTSEFFHFAFYYLLYMY